MDPPIGETMVPVIRRANVMVREKGGHMDTAVYL